MPDYEQVVVDHSDVLTKPILQPGFEVKSGLVYQLWGIVFDLPEPDLGTQSLILQNQWFLPGERTDRNFSNASSSTASALTSDD